MAKNIKPFEVIEGNLKAVKDTSDFGGPNMWRLHIKETNGCWSDCVQWTNLWKIQSFFKEKLPVYNDISKKNYELV